MKSSTRQFVFVKASEGAGSTAVEPTFVSDWSSAKEAGILRSAYAYFLPNEDPKLQASEFISLLQQSGVGELPPMLDWEKGNGASASQAVANAQIWLDQVEDWLRDDQKIAWTPIIYTEPGYWDSLKASASFARYPLYIADPSHSCPTVPAPWTSWVFWQGKTGTIPGVSNAVDLDTFNGSLDALQALASPQ